MLGNTVLDSQNYPTINFFGTDISLTDGQFLLAGMATIKGITDRIEISVYLKEEIKNIRQHQKKFHFYSVHLSVEKDLKQMAIQTLLKTQ